RGGALFKGSFFRADDKARAAVSVSTDQGRTFRPVWQDTQLGQHPVELDLTGFVEGAYGYLLRVELEAAKPGEVSFGGLELKNCLFYSPVFLPAVAPGSNAFTVELSEPSEQLCIEPDFSSMDRLKTFCYSIDNMEYGSRFNERLVPPNGQAGSLVVEIDPPGKGLVHWLTVYGGFAADPGAAGEDSMQILFAQNKPAGWRVIWEASSLALSKGWQTDYEEVGRPVLAEHWRLDKSVEVHPPTPLEKCYVRFRVKRNARASLNNLKVYAYYEPERRVEKPPLEDIVITHTWKEGSLLRSQAVSPASEKYSYVVAAGDSAIVNESVTIEVKNK
ncbi:MAG: hypothetical protein U9P14_04030, partial [Gemmatimonadota bacterium]|nr:hypothetical protein [Gemmatimonadota bacterium]